MPGLFNREIPTKLYEMYLRNGREELGLDPATEEGRGKIEQLKEGIVSELIDRTLIVVKMELYGELLRAELNKNFSVADDEIKKYYEAHKAEPILQQPERVTAAHILIIVPSPKSGRQFF